jgi:hypothetical protein
LLLNLENTVIFYYGFPYGHFLHLRPAWECDFDYRPRSQPKDLQTISLLEVDRIQLELDGKLLAESENDLEVHQTAKKIAIASC